MEIESAATNRAEERFQHLTKQQLNVKVETKHTSRVNK